MSVTTDMQALLESRSIGDKWDKMPIKARIKLLKAKLGKKAQKGRPLADVAATPWDELEFEYRSAIRPRPESNDMYMLRSITNYFRGK
jgi:hypothetical protein